MSNFDHEGAQPAAVAAAPYEVGNKRPPKHSRFKPGQSGNPKGRPKGSHSLSASVGQELRKPVTAMKGGKPVKMTKGGLIANQLVDNSMKNNLKATALVLKLEQQDCRELAKVEGDQSPAWPPPEKPRRNFEQIMRDFAQDMHEEAYQMMCDKKLSPKDPWEHTRELIIESHAKNNDKSDWSEKMFILMLASAKMIKDEFKGCRLLSSHS